MVARALWHLTPPENNGVETSKLTETRWYYWRHCDRRRSCWCGVVIQCPVSGLVVVRGGAGRRPTQPRPHPIPGLYPTFTQPRPIQLHFPCFQRTIVVLTITMEVEIKWGIRRIASIFDVQIDYHDRWGWHGILHSNSYEGQILNTHQSCSQARRGPVGV